MLAILINTSDATHVALTEAKEGEPLPFAVEAGREVAWWPKTMEEYRAKAVNLVPGKVYGRVEGKTWETMKPHPPAPPEPDGTMKLLAEYGITKRATDPVTWGDIVEIVRRVRAG